MKTGKRRTRTSGVRMKGWLPKGTLLSLFGTMLVLVGFAVGICVAHYRTFPYDVMVSVYRDPKAIASCLRNSIPRLSFLGTCFRTATEGQILHTHLYALEKKEVLLQKFAGKGGAIASLSRDLLVVTPRGRIAVIGPDAKESIYIAGNVPMEKSDRETARHDLLDIAGQIRVVGILLKEHQPGEFDLFVAHHYFTEECIRLRLSSTILIRGENSVNILPQWRTLFDAEPCLAFSPRRRPALNRAGGRMLVDGPHHLLLSIGDHGRDGWDTWMDTSPLPDNPASHLGKVVRIEIATGAAQILTSGHRNPQGMARSKDGRVWATEHGPEGGDELNLLRPGGKYGWPYVSYGTDSLLVPGLNGRGTEVKLTRVPGLIGEAEQVEATGRHDGFVRPVFAWVPSVATSDFVFNDNRWFPLWHNDLLISTLEDRSVHRVRLHQDKVQYVERIRVSDERIRDIALMPDGRIALLLDLASKVLFLSRSNKYCTEEFRRKRLVYALDCAAYADDTA